jgi:hypothetical protein
MTEDGPPFLRIQVTQLLDGWGQIRHAMPRVTRETYYRLAMLVRGPDRISISVGVRRAGSPYNYLWQKTQSYPPAWREVVYYFRCDAAGYDVNFYIMVNGAGINWVRLHDAGTPYIGWYHLERKPGEWSFQDRQLERCREYGLKILGAFATAPEWACCFDKPRNSYYDRCYQPRSLDEYGNYVRLVAGRYADLIDAYDLWNEPWIPSYWAIGYDESRQAYLTSLDFHGRSGGGISPPVPAKVAPFIIRC